MAACDFGCHQYLDSHPLEKVEFFKARLGDKFDLLNARARTPAKYLDIQALILYYKSKLEDMK